MPKKGIELDIFVESGTEPKIALKNGMFYSGIDINKQLVKTAQKRVKVVNPSAQSKL